jgi:shikimate kinase
MKNVVLIGMPAAGKSTIGVMLAKALGWSFLDTDILLQEKEKQLLQQIIDTHGIRHFLTIENKTILNLALKKHVIATGGSLIYSPQAITHLKKNGVLYYLKLDYETINKRLQNIQTRGVIMKNGQNLQDLYKERAPLYEKYADITLICENKHPEQIVTEIVRSIV